MGAVEKALGPKRVGDVCEHGEGGCEWLDLRPGYGGDQGQTGDSRRGEDWIPRWAHIQRDPAEARRTVWGWNVVWELQGLRTGVDEETTTDVRVKGRFGP